MHFCAFLCKTLLYPSPTVQYTVNHDEPVPTRELVLDEEQIAPTLSPYYCSKKVCHAEIRQFLSHPKRSLMNHKERKRPNGELQHGQSYYNRVTILLVIAQISESWSGSATPTNFSHSTCNAMNCTTVQYNTILYDTLGCYSTPDHTTL